MAFNRKARLQANIDAIRMAFALCDEVRVPTDAEREIISQYCGFGGLKCVLNPVDNKAAWSKNDLPLYDLTAELHRVIRENSEDETEYKRYVASMFEHPRQTGKPADSELARLSTSGAQEAKGAIRKKTVTTDCL